MRALKTLALVAALTFVPTLGRTAVVQTITIDGVNDFLPANLVEQDGGDTQYTEIDLGDIYLTNDANRLYLGYAHQEGSWATVQLGVAIDVNTPGGGTSDPWSRKLEWSSAEYKPDFIYYINLDSNWQAGYRWTGVWTSVVAGPNALGVPIDTGFREYGILLSSLGVAAGDLVHVEVWVTQDGNTKGPLDAAANDAVQLSTPGGTIFDVTVPVAMTLYHSFTILDATDTVPPAVELVGMSASDEVFVQFSEAVSGNSATVPGNYTLPGAAIVAAAIDGAQPNIVRLSLGADLPVDADLYTLTVHNVTDLAGNPIGDQDSGSFLWKTVTFLGHMSRYLAAHGSPPDGFTVEGGTWPLTWELCDGAATVALGDGDYQWTGSFWAPGDGQGGASMTFEWKFVHNCATYEPLPQNRTHTVLLDGSDSDLIEVWWNDEDPADFTLHAVDVLFFVDLSEFAPGLDDTVGIGGNVAPLDQAWPPAAVMVDDGTGVAALAGGAVYSAVVRFPTDSRKEVTYKFRLDGAYECFGQGDRDVYLNDELFDIVGGPLGPLTLPLYHYDACWVSWRPVEVIFRYNVGATGLPGGLDDPVYAVNGTRSNQEPPAFSWDLPSLNPLADDGIAPDEVAGDLLYTVAVVFPDSSNLFTEYKYLIDDQYEPLEGNRSFWLDPDLHDALGNAQILDEDYWPVGVPDDVPDARLSGLVNVPNPFNPGTEIRFTVHRAGEGSLRVYDAQGRLLRTLHGGWFATGPQVFAWDGRDDGGREVASGLYVYRLELSGQVGTRKMLLVK